MAKAKIKRAIVLIATALACAAVILVAARSHSSATVFVLILGSIALLFCEYMASSLFFSSQPRAIFGQTGMRALCVTVGISVAVGVLLEAGTLIGAPIASPLDPASWSLKRVALFSFIVFGGVLFRHWYWGERIPTAFFTDLRTIGRSIAPKQAAIAAAVFVAVILVALIGCLSNGLAIKSSFAFSLAFATAVSAVILLARHHGDHPEYAFLVIVVAAGTYLSFAIPPMTLVSWDDQVHYKNAMSLSYIFNAEVSSNETPIMYPEQFLDDDTSSPSTNAASGSLFVAWREGEIDSYVNRVDSEITRDSYRPAGNDFSPLSYQAFGYMASASALWLARLLHLPFSWGFQLAKWFNLLCYALVCFAAIRVLPVKKTLFAVLALLPTGVFLASNPSYDPWTTSMTGLAVALTIREICDADQPLTKKRFAAIAIAFIAGLGPKAIYFPLIGLLFLMPKRKFSDDRHRRLFIASTFALAILIVCSFAVSFLISSGVATDYRGGTDVDSTAQIKYVLSNPVEAAQVIGGFIFGKYLSVAALGSYTSFFAYLGMVQNAIPLPALLLVAYYICIAFADNYGKKRISGIGGKLWTLFLCLVTIALFTLALYVSFTPVGFETVNGVQGRYLAPLLFPVLAVCSSLAWENPVKASRFSGFALSASGLLLFVAIFAIVTLHIAA